MEKFLAALAIAAVSTVAIGAPGDLIDLKSPHKTAAFQATNPIPESVWLVWGGEASLAFNPDGLVALDMRISDVKGASQRTPGLPGQVFDLTTFPARDSGTLEVLHQGSVVGGFGGGQINIDGGLVLHYPGGDVDLRGFAIRPDSTTRLGLEVVDASGTVWFTADHPHYGFDPKAPGVFSMYNMNLRISPHFAAVLGRPDLDSYVLGGLGFRAHAPIRNKSAEVPAGGVCNAPFPGPNLNTDIALLYDDGAHSWTNHDDMVTVRRCGLPPLPSSGTCTASSTNGKLVIDQDSSLRNVGETAVAWYDKFNNDDGGTPQPPYNNDQHPYLIWNMYRVDSDGRIKQIGVSAVKHAFLTVNWAHSPSDCGCDAGHVIYPSCEDTYSTNNNDNMSSGGSAQNNLSPRSEVIPYTAQWGRCGSNWDPNCDGHGPDSSTPSNLYLYRLLATESDMLPPLSTGAHYFFEYWYIVRDDSNIYNTMGYREILPQKTGSSWSVSLVNAAAPDHDFFLGPAINRWVDPASPPANAQNKELSTPLGRARVAVKSTDLGNGQWRYEYSVMNFDYAHAAIDPAHPSEPNMKLLSNHGFSSFKVPLPAGATGTSLRFDDADGDGSNDWSGAVSSDSVTWTAPAAGNTLDWGTLYHFEFTSNAAPGADTLTVVGVATTSEAALPYSLDLLGPLTVSNDIIFKNGFD